MAMRQESGTAAAMIDEAPDGVAAAFGGRVRAARLRRELSLAQVAAAARVSKSLVSQIERGVATASLDTVRRLASALGVPVFSLFLDERGDQFVVRANERRTVRYPDSGVTREILSPNLRGRLAVLWVTFPPGEGTSPETVRHVGEECVVVLTGTLDVLVGDGVIRLGAGDSMTFDSELPHLFRNTTDEPVRAIVAITPPNL